MLGYDQQPFTHHSNTQRNRVVLNTGPKEQGVTEEQNIDNMGERRDLGEERFIKNLDTLVQGK